jgi:hypothetical protein
VLAKLGGPKVFDEPPGDKDRPALPYVYLGAVNRTRIETGEYPAWTIRMRFFVASVNVGRVQAWEICHALGDAVEGAFPEVAAPWRMDDRIIVAQAGDVIDPMQPKAAFLDIQAVLGKAA